MSRRGRALCLALAALAVVGCGRHRTRASDRPSPEPYVEQKSEPDEATRAH